MNKQGLVNLGSTVGNEGNEAFRDSHINETTRSMFFVRGHSISHALSTSKLSEDGSILLAESTFGFIRASFLGFPAKGSAL